MSVQQNNADVEMFVLRRSARIADKQRLQLNVSVKTETPAIKWKTPLKRTSEVSKMNVDSQVKKKTRKARKPQKKAKKVIDKFADLDKTKISDLFPLIEKYSLSENEKNEKYVIIRTIIKRRNLININNRLTEVYINRNNIVTYLYYEYLHTLHEYSFTLDVISNHLNDILSYKEIDDLDTVVMTKRNENIMKDTNKAENEIYKGLQEMDKLNAMICRLML